MRWDVKRPIPRPALPPRHPSGGREDMVADGINHVEVEEQDLDFVYPSSD